MNTDFAYYNLKSNHANSAAVQFTRHSDNGSSYLLRSRSPVVLRSLNLQEINALISVPDV